MNRSPETGLRLTLDCGGRLLQRTTYKSKALSKAIAMGFIAAGATLVLPVLLVYRPIYRMQKHGFNTQSNHHL